MASSDFVAYILTLDCGAKVYARVELKNQYPTDEHYVLCAHCIKLIRDPYAKSQPMAWQAVTATKGVLSNDLRDVQSRHAFIMPDRIMRIQHGIPINRARPFPYKIKRRTT